MSDSDPDTLQLIDRWSRGDADALPLILERELPWIRDYVVRRLGPALRAHAEAADYVQDAVLDFLRSAPRFQVATLEQFRALMARVVENNLRDKDAWYRARRRARDREQPLPSDSVVLIGQRPPSMTTPSAAADRQDWKVWVRLALELMDPEDRRVLLRREWDGASFVEIGAELGMTANAVRMRWVRAVARLADKVRDLKAGKVE